MKRLVATVCSALIMTCGQSQAMDDLAEEELLFEDIPVVISASRMEQLITEAPSTVTVITEDEIRRSGSLNIPEILRMVPGIDVMQISSGHYEVSSRGFNNLYSNKMLVMIDGRSVYQDYFGWVEWETFPILLEDIKRIEVVRGPGSSLYGANAFQGVINIITKLPDDYRTLNANATIGTRDTQKYSLLHSGKKNALEYNLSIAKQKTDQWNSDRSGDGVDKIFGRGVLQYNLSPNASVLLDGGFNDADLESFRRDLDDSFVIDDISNGYGKLQYNNNDLLIRSFWNFTDETDLTVNTYDVEFQNTFRTVDESHRVMYGASFRHNIIESSTLKSGEVSQNLYAAFIQDDFKMNEKWNLVYGARFDNHPESGSNFSPRGSLLYTPEKGHTFIAMAGKAFRNPSALELYQKNVFFVGPGAMSTIQGNTELDPESITSFELAYKGRPNSKLEANVNVYYNVIDDLIETVVDDFWPMGYPGWGAPRLITRKNVEDAEAFGSELSMAYFFTPEWKISANYTYQKVEYDDGTPVSFSPEHKLNAQLSWNLKNGLDGQLSAHYVSDTEGYAGEGITGSVDSYVLVNGSIGYWFKEDTVRGQLSGFNLTNEKHREFPLGDELETLVTATLSFYL